MLKILAYQPQHHDAAYYRGFIRAAKPTIKEELTEAGIIKAHNGDFAMAEELFLALTGLNPEDVDTRPQPGVRPTRNTPRPARTTRDRRRRACGRARSRPTGACWSWIRCTRTPISISPTSTLPNGATATRGRTCRFTSGMAPTPSAGKRPAGILRRMSEDGLEEENFRRAYELVRDGSEREGLHKIETFLASHPDVWQAHFVRGWALRRTGSYAEAKRAFETVLTHAPADGSGRHGGYPQRVGHLQPGVACLRGGRTQPQGGAATRPREHPRSCPTWAFWR